MGVEAEVSEIDLDNTWSLRGPSDVVRVESGRDKVTSLSSLSQRQPASAVEFAETVDVPSSTAAAAPPRRDWAAALTLVQEAAEAIRFSEERVQELRREADAQAQLHLAELTALHGQLLSAQREIEAANQRIRAADQRADEANDWLARMDDAITAHLGGLGRAS